MIKKKKEFKWSNYIPCTEDILQVANSCTIYVKFGLRAEEDHFFFLIYFSGGKRWGGERESAFRRDTAWWDFFDWRSGTGWKGGSARRENRSQRSATEYSPVTQGIYVTCCMKYKRSQHLIWSEGCILYLSLGSLMASLSRHNESIADTTFPQSSFDTLKRSMFTSTRPKDEICIPIPS